MRVTRLLSLALATAYPVLGSPAPPLAERGLLGNVAYRYCSEPRFSGVCKFGFTNYNICTNYAKELNDRVRSFFAAGILLSRCDLYEHYDCQGKSRSVTLLGSEGIDLPDIRVKESSFKCYTAI